MDDQRDDRDHSIDAGRQAAYALLAICGAFLLCDGIWEGDYRNITCGLLSLSMLLNLPWPFKK
jgi:hypothetical protein